MRYGCDISLKYDFGSGVPCVGVIQLGHIYAANKKLGVIEFQLRCGRKKLVLDLESFFQAFDKDTAKLNGSHQDASLKITMVKC